MLFLYQSIILGIVQGLAEFLPISSSGHLWAIPYLFSWNQPGLKFDTALHFGTAIAVIGFFYRDWISIFRSAFTKKNGTQYSTNMLWQIAVATIPAAIGGLLLEKTIETKLDSALIVAFTMAVFGLILWLVDKYASSEFRADKIGYKQSLLIGVAQCLALIPGISRSGITMIAARSIGISRENAARFSFLIGTPATLGAFLWEARKLTAADLNLEFIAGVLFATFFGFLAIKLLLNYLKKSNFSIFAWYRFGFALLILVVYLVRLK